LTFCILLLTAGSASDPAVKNLSQVPKRTQPQTNLLFSSPKRTFPKVQVLNSVANFFHLAPDLLSSPDNGFTVHKNITAKFADSALFALETELLKFSPGK